MIFHSAAGVLTAQLVVILTVSRALGLFARRLRQPLVIAEVVAGILLGPSLLGWVAPGALATLFPSSSLESLRMLSHVGLVLFMFLVGLAVPFFSTPSMTLLQETVEPERQGRVFGFVGIVMAVAMPVGMVVFGPLADAVPIETLLIAAGILTFVVIGLAVWLPAGQRAITAARQASQVAAGADPATRAAVVEQAMHKDS